MPVAQTPTPNMRTYTRSRQPTVHGAEKLWTDNELAAIQNTISDLQTAIEKAYEAIRALQALQP